MKYRTACLSLTFVCTCLPAFASETLESGEYLPTDYAEELFFGGATAIEEGIVGIGAIYDDELAYRSGAVYLFGVESLNQLRKLVAPDGAERDFFGGRVSMGDGLVVVSSIGADTSVENSGAVYVFDATTGDFLHKLDSPNPVVNGFFGISTDVADGMIAVGASGEGDGDFVRSGNAYLFDAISGELIRSFAASDAELFEEFGNAVAIVGSTLAVNCRHDEVAPLSRGSVFLIDIATGEELDRLTAVEGARVSDYGGYLCAKDGILAVGTHKSGVPVDLYETVSFQRIGMIEDPVDDGGRFGAAIDIAQGRIVIGAQDQRSSAGPGGAAYVFDIATQRLITELKPGIVQGFDFFGVAVAIEGDTVVVGASRKDRFGEDSGAATRFDLRMTCPGDVNGDQRIDLTDLNIILGKFGQATAAGAPGDFDNSGAFDLPDLNAVLGAFGNDCP